MVKNTMKDGRGSESRTEFRREGHVLILNHPREYSLPLRTLIVSPE